MKSRPICLRFLPLYLSSASAFLSLGWMRSQTTTSSSTRRLETALEAKRFNHALAILAMPYTSMDRIANEAILERVLPVSNRLSVVLRCEGATPPSVASLRRYAGDVYSQLWDAFMDTQTTEVPDVVVYPANLPNTAPESWVNIQPDLDCICTHDSLIGWTSEGATGSGERFRATEGVGGLDKHVVAVNSERKDRNLRPVRALHVDQWPMMDENVVFLDDDENWEVLNCDVENSEIDLLLGGVKIPSRQLFESVAVGGTFDGLHFGHRKLLTLAVSSVSYSGRLLVGITADAMLTQKKYAKFIPTLQERKRGVEQFLQRLAPGMMNRIKLVEINDPFGPAASPDKHFDALVLSHETLATGYMLNNHRVERLGLEPLALLCTRRTESYGMSSTTLRRLRSAKEKGETADAPVGRNP